MAAPATGVSYGAKGKAYFYRAKSTLDGLLKPKPDATGTAPLTAEKELILGIIGKPQFTPQDDGTYEISFPHAEHRPEVTDFEDNYRELASSGGSSKSAYKSADGLEYGGAADTSNIDPIFFAYAGGIDPDSGKIQVIVGFAKVLGSTGGFTLDPDNPTERSLTIRTLKPKADFIYHLGDQSFTTLDTGAVDIASEIVDLKVLLGDPKCQFWLTAV